MLKRLLVLLTLLIAPSVQAGFLAGASRVRMTGPTLGPLLMGYANPSQVARGLHMDLFVRAIVVVDEDSKQRTALVNLDLSQVSPSLKEAVIQALEATSRGHYSHHNVLLSGTHTHAAPGGLSHDPLYTVASLGFEPEYFAVAVERIVESIVRAESHLEPVSVEWIEDRLDGMTRNRSEEAHTRNPEASQLQNSLDPRVQQLNFKRADGTLLAVWNVFAIHGTSFPNSETYVSGDNKGWAAWRVEQELPIVAALANGAAGDVSPDPLGRGEAEEIFQATRIVSEAQANKVLQIAGKNGARLEGPLSAALQWVEMPSLQGLCDPAIGYSMLAGAEDGPSNLPGLREGITREDAHHLSPLTRGIVAAIKVFFGFTAEGDAECHEEKAVAFYTGTPESPGTPRTLPFQLIRLGNLVLAGIPFEATTVSGIRIRSAIQGFLGKRGVEHVMLVGYANSYVGYLSTPEEYELQHYEGASTHFGKRTLLGVIDSFKELVSVWQKSGAGVYGSAPPPTQPPHWSNGSRKSIDVDSSDSPFGAVLQNPRRHYQAGEWMKVVFRASNPNNDLSEMRRWISIERKSTSGWILAATEENPETFIQWERITASPRQNCGSCIHARVSWRIPEDTKRGLYRVRFQGKARVSENKLRPFSGLSREFVIE